MSTSIFPSSETDSNIQDRALALVPDPLDDDPAPQFTLVHGSADADTAWILVGDAQAKAAASCRPDGVAVFAVDKRVVYFAATRPDGLEVVEGKKVLIFPEGDASTDHTVFDRCTKFGRTCEDEGASEVLFTWLGADLDVHLDNRSADQRKLRLATVIARTGKKPAKAKPPAPSATQQRTQSQMAELEEVAATQGRPVIDVNADRLLVLNRLVDAIQDGPFGDRIFDLGGQLAITTRNDRGALVAEVLDEKKLLNVLSASSQMISKTTRGVSAAWPETKTLMALFGRYRNFRGLSRIAPSPIVRADHTIATEPGYDVTSQVLLDTDGLTLDVPDEPTHEHVHAAIKLLLDDWLGDFPFVSQADRANTLALILTFPMRELVNLLPLAYVVAKSQGTGKSKLASLIVFLFTGTFPDLDSLPEHEEEIRKQITTLLSAAPQAILFDESPEIGGRSINRFLTTRHWSDRLLGGNKRASLPNDAVIMATANNGQALGDTRRRYYPIELFFDGENPENRPESVFRHADIEAWTEEHRGELLSAVFTLIGAWQLAGRPKRPTSFGSFERWEAVVGGVLHNAGVTDFLGNLHTHRESSDYDEGLWVAHLRWLEDLFPSGLFTVSNVIDSMTTTGNKSRQVKSDVDLPPGLDRTPVDPGYAAALGKLYHARQGRMCDGVRILATKGKTGNKTVWRLELSERLVAARVEQAAEATKQQAAEESAEVALRAEQADKASAARAAADQLLEAWFAAARDEYTLSDTEHVATMRSGTPYFHVCDRCRAAARDWLDKTDLPSSFLGAAPDPEKKLTHAFESQLRHAGFFATRRTSEADADGGDSPGYSRSSHRVAANPVATS